MVSININYYILIDNIYLFILIDNITIVIIISVLLDWSPTLTLSLVM